MNRQDKKHAKDKSDDSFETFNLPKDYALKLFGNLDNNKSGTLNKKETKDTKDLMKEFMKQIEQTTCRNDIIEWQKSLDKKMLYKVFCIEGQTWLVGTILKMYWKIQENPNFSFAISPHGITARTNTKDIIKSMPIALPLDSTFMIKAPVKKYPKHITDDLPMSIIEAENLLIQNTRICGMVDIFDSITLSPEQLEDPKKIIDIFNTLSMNDVFSVKQSDFPKRKDDDFWKFPIWFNPFSLNSLYQWIVVSFEINIINHYIDSQEKIKPTIFKNYPIQNRGKTINVWKGLDNLDKLKIFEDAYEDYNNCKNELHKNKLKGSINRRKTLISLMELSKCDNFKKKIIPELKNNVDFNSNSGEKFNESSPENTSCKNDSVRKNILNLINTSEDINMVDLMLYPILSMVDNEISYTLSLMGFTLTKIVFDRMINEVVEEQDNKKNLESRAKKRKMRALKQNVHSETKSGFIFQMCNQESMIIKEIEKENSDSAKDESKSQKKYKSKSRSKSISKNLELEKVNFQEKENTAKKKKKRNKKNKKIQSNHVVRKKSDSTNNEQAQETDIKEIQSPQKSAKPSKSKKSGIPSIPITKTKRSNTENEAELMKKQENRDEIKKKLNCLKRYDNYYSDDEKLELSADPDYLDKANIKKNNQMARKTNSVQNGYENNFDSNNRASSFTKSRKQVFDDIKSTSYCTKTLSSMTESYFIHKKRHMNHNALTTEMKESTVKESTVKENSVDSISINSNTEPNKYNDDLTHYTETNSIDRAKTRKIENNLAYKHIKKNDIKLTKNDKNIINQRTQEKELKNQIYNLENELVNTQHAYNINPKENYNSLINSMSYFHSTSFNKNLRSFRGRQTEKKVQNKSNERHEKVDKIDMTQKINDNFNQKNPVDHSLNSLKKTNSLYNDKLRVNVPVKIPHNTNTINISNQINNKNCDKNLHFEKWEKSISPKPAKDSFNKNKEAKTPNSLPKNDTQIRKFSSNEAICKEQIDNQKTLSEANKKSLSRQDSINVTNSHRNIETTKFEITKEIKKKVDLKIEIDKDIKTTSQQNIHLPETKQNIECNRPKTPPLNVQNFVLDVLEKPISDIVGIMRPKSYSNSVYNIENLETEAQVVKSQTIGTKNTKENMLVSPLNFAKSQQSSNIDQNTRFTLDETKSETIENKANSVQRPSSAIDKSRNNQKNNENIKLKAPNTPTNERFCVDFVINASPWHSPERKNSNGQSEYYSQKKSAKKADYFNNEVPTNKYFNNDINLNLNISNYNKKKYKEIGNEKKIYNNYSKMNYYNEFPHMSHSNYNTNQTKNYINEIINNNNIITMTLPMNPRNYYNYRYQNIPNKNLNVPDRTQINIIDAKEVANEFFMNHLKRNVNNLCFNLNEYSKSLEDSRKAVFERLKKVSFYF